MELLGTLFLPLSERSYIFPKWETTIRGLNIPRERIKCVLVDSTGGSDVGLKAEEIINSMGFAYTKVCRFKQEPNPPIRDHWTPHLRIGEKVGETYDIGLPFVDGPLFMCIEDDIIAPPDSFKVLIDRLLSNKNIGMLEASTYYKIPLNKTKIISFDENNENLIDTGDLPELIKCSGSSIGCFVTYSSLIKHFSMKDSVLDNISSPDFTYCDYLKRSFGLDNYTITSVKTKHIFSKAGIIFEAGRYNCPTESKPFPDHTDQYTTIPIKKRVSGEPIFIVSFTYNMDDNLIQRLFSSIRGVMIWGEDNGAINNIFDFHKKMIEIDYMSIVKESRNQFNEYGYRGWIENISPPLPEKPKDNLKSILEWHFKRPKYKVWGLKTNNWSPKIVSRIHNIFPDASFIFINNNIQDIKAVYHNKNIDELEQQYNLFWEYTKTLPLDMHSIIIDVQKEMINICDVLESEFEFKNIDRSLLEK